MRLQCTHRSRVGTSSKESELERLISAPKLKQENPTYFAKSMALCGSSAAAIVSFGRKVSIAEGGEVGLRWGKLSNGPAQ